MEYFENNGTTSVFMGDPRQPASNGTISTGPASLNGPISTGSASSNGPISTGSASNIGRCSYDENSQFDTSNCNKCFSNNNCRTSDCKSVCNLNLCEGKDDIDCEANAIVDLYKSLFNKYKDHHNSLDNNDIQQINIDFSSIASSGENAVSRNIWNMLTGMYNFGTINSKGNYVDSQRLGNVLKSQEQSISDDGEFLNTMQRVDSTMKRQIEINLYDYRKTEYNVNIFKQIIIVIGIGLIFPVLVKFNILDRNTGLVIWGVLMVVILVYAIFMIYVKNSNRDDIDFNKFNFVKPTDEEIARSRLANAMSKSDKANCQALAEMDNDFDPASVNIDITPYLSSESEPKCFRN